MGRKKIRTVLGDHLAKARKERGLTQMEVARILGYSGPQFVCNWERGVAPPPLETLKRLAELYHLDRSKLVELLMRQYRNELRRVLK